MPTSTSSESALHRLVRRLFYRQGTSIFSVLRVADFRNLWIGQMISFVGDALAYNTMTLGIIRMANAEGVSAGKILSLLYVLSALPSLFLGMVAGTLADRVNRKHMMIAADVIRAFLTLGFIVVHDLDQVWIYIIVSVALSTVSTFFYPARTALLPQMLRRDELLSANAMAQFTHTLAFVVGAAAAGFMVGLTDATAPAFVGDSLSFFLSAYFISRISISGRVTRAAAAAADTAHAALRRSLASLRAMAQELLVGLRYVLSDQIMRGVLISFLAMMLGLGAANVTFVPLLINELGMKEQGLGLIRFSQTLGIIAGSTAIASIAPRYRARDLIGLSMLLFGITTMIVAVVQNYALMVAVLFLVGLVIAPPQIVASTLMQRHVPHEKLGRASGAQGTIVNVANIASMGAAGYLMDEIGAREVFLLSGVLIFGAGIVSWWVLRSVTDAPPGGLDEASAPEAASVAPASD